MPMCRVSLTTRHVCRVRHTHTHTHTHTPSVYASRLVGSLKLQVSFVEYRLFYMSHALQQYTDTYICIYAFIHVYTHLYTFDMSHVKHE